MNKTPSDNIALLKGYDNNNNNKSQMQNLDIPKNANIASITRLLSTNGTCEQIKNLIFSGEASTKFENNGSAIQVGICDYLQHSNLILNAIEQNKTVKNIKFYDMLSNSVKEEKDLLLCEKLIHKVLQLPTLTDLHFCYYHSDADGRFSEMLLHAFNNSTNTNVKNLRIFGCGLWKLLDKYDNSDNNKTIKHRNFLERFFHSIIQSCPTLKQLDLGYNMIGGDGLEMLYEALVATKEASSLEALVLDRNLLDNKSCNALSKILASPDMDALKSLTIRGSNKITESGLRVLLKEGLCCNTTLKEIHIGLNSIPECGWELILNGLKYNQIMALEVINSNLKSYSRFCSQNIFEEILFYLRLNKAGRRRIVLNSNIQDNNVISAGEQWIQCLYQVNDSLRCLHYFISHNPEQCHFE